MCSQKPEMTMTCIDPQCVERATVGVNGRAYCEEHFVEEWASIGAFVAKFGGMYEMESRQTEIAPFRKASA